MESCLLVGVVVEAELGVGGNYIPLRRLCHHNVLNSEIDGYRHYKTVRQILTLGCTHERNTIQKTGYMRFLKPSILKELPLIIRGTREWYRV